VVARDETGALSARRLTKSGRQTRERIIVAASALMFARGVAGTSIPDLQKAANVGASQIYHYFGDKQGLVRAVIDHQIEESLNSQRPILDHLDSFEALRAWCDDAVARQQERDCEGGCEIGSLAAELVESDPIVRSDLVNAFERWERPIRNGLTRMKERGELRAEADVHELAMVMLSAIQGGYLLTQIQRSIEPLKSATSAAVTYIESFATS
jgi:TetR/AcrR family transcriptional regulator, transcriptional repressor for nem operon